MPEGNFHFLDSQFSTLAENAKRAEKHIYPDPRAASFYARFALEAAVQWLYANDRTLRIPYDQSLGALIHEPCFQKLVPEAVFQKARLIQKAGNMAVHSQRIIRQYDALMVVKELHHFLFWLARTFTTGKTEIVPAFDPAIVPRPVSAPQPLDAKKIEALENDLQAKTKALLEREEQLTQLDTTLEALRSELAAAKAANAKVPDSHDYSEAETRTYLIDIDLRRAGWPLDQARDKEYEVRGMPNAQGIGYVDYVIWGDDGKPLAVIEAKKTTVDGQVGQQQAKLYADCLEKMTGQRPVIFYTNGYETWIWDDTSYPPRRTAGFYSKDDLQRLVQRRSTRKPIDVSQINGVIVERYYQKRAIGSLCASFAAFRRKGLLVMATGTGKTRMAIALTDILQRMNWAKRILFLADRVSLVNQAANAFKKFLPESSPVNLVTEKDKEGRVYVCTYPTMMGLIDQTKSGEAKFGVGHFDLVIIDEAHRSVYQKFGAIFEYFDSLLIGLTATPRDQVDKNTYELFDLESGVPTDAYELEEAVKDGHLVPPKAEQVDLKFPREGIRYDDLSDEEKAEWESIDWGDNAQGATPNTVNASAVNNWLFNKDTVDKVLKHLMEHGHKVHGGDRLGKTIIFARNHEHAKFIEERFNTHYPHYAGHFARIIDNYAKYPQSLIDDFSQKDKEPHIAISVDMLDTGIDVPEVVNLVFFKPVYSKIKFWQMIGRGTRLCPDLFGPSQDKENFRVFDFCFNFEYFRENPDGIEGSGGESLAARLFKSRLRVLTALRKQPDLEETGALAGSLTSTLHGEVQAMNPENFIVRMRLEAVERFQRDEAWSNLSEGDVETLNQQIAGLPSSADVDDIEARMFDLTGLRLQLARIENDNGRFEAIRHQVVEIAVMLEEKDSIPAVREQLAYIQSLQETTFWEGITLALLEDLRLRLRGLVQFIDKKKRTIVYTNFKDEIQRIGSDEVIAVPKMTGTQYEKKVREYITGHQDHIAIQKLRQNAPLTQTDLSELERMLVEIGSDEGKDLLASLLVKSEAPSLPYFVRRLVGMDRAAAQKLFGSFLSDQRLTPQQIRFVELLIDQLTARGVMESSALYEPPFSDLNDGGPEAVFYDKENIVEDIFTTLEKTQPKVMAA
jgi:type I restriction enzyme R subunit